ncbi:MAG: hypothetical protein QM765_34330 [Myxococcales bacterium]
MKLVMPLAQVMFCGTAQRMSAGSFCSWLRMLTMSSGMRWRRRKRLLRWLPTPLM